MKKALDHALDFLFPPRCLVSHQAVEEQGMLAPHIWAKLNFIAEPFCVSCGMPFAYEIEAETRCAVCLEAPPDYDSARSAMIYDDHSRDLVLGFKHGDQTHAVRAFMPWLEKAGSEIISHADVIIPVPLHRLRLLSRRYNQAALLAQYLGRKVDKDVLVEGLLRVKATPSQGYLKPHERAKNVRKAFRVNLAYTEYLKGKNVLLIDDVYTSGATVNECARVLKREAEVATVHVLTITKVVKH